MATSVRLLTPTLPCTLHLHLLMQPLVYLKSKTVLVSLWNNYILKRKFRIRVTLNLLKCVDITANAKKIQKLIWKKKKKRKKHTLYRIHWISPCVWIVASISKYPKKTQIFLNLQKKKKGYTLKPEVFSPHVRLFLP